MSYAALTFVYNEKHNLPLWLAYYGKLFGLNNLYVIDRSSDDGSTDSLGDVNVIRIPRRKFDELEKTNIMSSFHSALTSAYDAVVVTDADEFLVPDPVEYKDLNDYILKMEGDYANAVGIHVIHILDKEGPLDPGEPVLSQRRYGRFHAPVCKHLLSRTPTRWLPGLHSSNKPPRFDTNLYNFHLKLMDYNLSVERQRVNLATAWSDNSLFADYGRHHRWDIQKFVQNYFIDPMNVVNSGHVSDFRFVDELKDLEIRTYEDDNGSHIVPMDLSKMVRIPDRFCQTV